MSDNSERLSERFTAAVGEGMEAVEWHDDEGDHSAAVAADMVTLALRASR